MSEPEGDPGTATPAGALRPKTRSVAHRRAGEDVLPVEGRLGSFDRARGWLNSKPLSSDALRGRVVLVDFWTYTCVNWLRTLPYLKAWNAKYAASGLTVVGVHTPEFRFERDLSNVIARSQDLGVDYPIAIDDHYGVWEDFANHYWPAVYLADAHGRVRFHHFGEGEYAMTEMAIQQLLVEAGAEIDLDLVDVEPRGLEVAADWASLGSPETYLGYDRADGFVGGMSAPYDRPHSFPPAGRLGRNTWSLEGEWSVTREAVEVAAPGSRLSFAFRARDVNLVAAPAPGRAVPIRVTLDGAPIGIDHGADIDADGRGTIVDANTLQLVRQTGAVVDRVVQIEFLEAGAAAYCLTFG
ncbi:redoxin family protein [Microbacterium yannicii]|uniref:redoxin family protein n=1 Tax=Microbacterium yannicii TaxID=671622 RepID=UPI00036825C6|nr:redoxin family protein [Microbacterium yannicii]